MYTTFGLELVIQTQPVFQVYIKVGLHFKGNTQGKYPLPILPWLLWPKIVRLYQRTPSGLFSHFTLNRISLDFPCRFSFQLGPILSIVNTVYVSYVGCKHVDTGFHTLFQSLNQETKSLFHREQMGLSAILCCVDGMRMHMPLGQLWLLLHKIPQNQGIYLVKEGALIYIFSTIQGPPIMLLNPTQIRS